MHPIFTGENCLKSEGKWVYQRELLSTISHPSDEPEDHQLKTCSADWTTDLFSAKAIEVSLKLRKVCDLDLCSYFRCILRPHQGKHLPMCFQKYLTELAWKKLNKWTGFANRVPFFEPPQAIREVTESSKLTALVRQSGMQNSLRNHSVYWVLQIERWQ